MLKGKTPDVLEALFVLFVLLFGAGVGVVGGFIGYEIGKPDEPPAAVAPLVDSGPATAAPTTTAAAGATTDETTAGEATTSAATSTPGDAAAGEQVFDGAGCGSCHTLAAAGAAGLVGPNLDQAKPSFAQVVNIVSNGGGAMPTFSDRLSKSQIADLAAFVTQAVGGGTPTETGSTPADGETANDGNDVPTGSASPSSGRQAFAGAGCGSCHTLAAAGAAGLVGPNLDQANPSFAQVVNIVSNGGGAMPAFSDRLSKSQIADLAAFVTQAVGGGTPTETGQGDTSGATTTKPVELVLKEGRLTGGLRFVPAGKTTFSVRNAGAAGNWFAVLRANTSRLVFLGKLTNIRPGQRRSLTLTLSKGTYLLACCSQPGKLERGMFSTVKVSS